jgi:hypothetical protein
MGRTVLADLAAVERKTERFSERNAPASEFGLLVGSLSEKGKDFVYDLIPAPPMSVPPAMRCRRTQFDGHSCRCVDRRATRTLRSGSSTTAS